MLKIFLNLRVGKKLALGFGFCLALTVAITSLLVNGMAKMAKQNEILYADNVSNAVLLTDLIAHTKSVRLFQFRLLLAKDADARAKTEKSLTDKLVEVETDLAGLDKGLLATDREMFGKMSEFWKAYMVPNEQFKALAATGSPEAQKMLETTMHKTNKDFEAALSDLAKANRERANKIQAAAKATYASNRTEAVSLLIASLIIGCLVGTWVAKSVVNPIRLVGEALKQLQAVEIQSLTRASQAMAEGDLTFSPTSGTCAVPIRSKDELGQMGETFNALVSNSQSMVASFTAAQENLAQLISDLADSADQVNHTTLALESSADTVRSTADDIAQSMDSVARASDESARSATEIAKGSEGLAITATQAATAMQTLESSIANVQELGVKQQEVATEASVIATEGGTAVKRTTDGMKRISEQMGVASSVIADLGEKGQQIGAIVQAIEEISGQTNLLALNAAIEAARAGDHGRGFAVVADEVRKLAERATQSAGEIAELIGSVRQGVDHAVQAMDSATKEVEINASRSQEAADALARILDSMDHVQQATKASKEAVASISMESRRVMDNISTVAGVSQEAASGAEEMSATSEEVSASAAQVSDAVSRQTASLADVAIAVKELGTMSSNLEEHVKRFRIDRGDEIPVRRAA